MSHPCIGHLNDQAVGAAAAEAVSMHFASGPKSKASGIEVQLGCPQIFLQVPGDDEADTGTIVRMPRQRGMGVITGLEKPESRNIPDLADFTMVARP
ncbi:MAG TPA: hypothetical protein VI685_21155 [Candidatus Angelobacter sp.]